LDVDVDVDVDQISVGYIMSAVLITIGEDYSPSDTLNVVQQHGVRRQPEVDSNGVLPVLIDMEIILKILCQDLGKMLALINTERNIQKCLRS
jgi:predicted transcriptional regulator